MKIYLVTLAEVDSDKDFRTNAQAVFVKKENAKKEFDSLVREYKEEYKKIHFEEDDVVFTDENGWFQSSNNKGYVCTDTEDCFEFWLDGEFDREHITIKIIEDKIEDFDENSMDEKIEKIAFELNFTTDEVKAIIPYMLKHNNKLNSVADFVKEWEYNWFRNYNFERDIIDHEYANTYKYSHINTKKELREYILKNHVYTLESNNDLNDWSLYKVTDKLWIERL